MTHGPLDERKREGPAGVSLFPFSAAAGSAPAVWDPACGAPRRTRPLSPNRAMAKYRKGTEVSWSWGSGTATGKVQETFTEKVTRTIKGTEVTRNASDDEPAYLVEQEDGDRVLKSESELSKV